MNTASTMRLRPLADFPLCLGLDLDLHVVFTTVVVNMDSRASLRPILPFLEQMASGGPVAWAQAVHRTCRPDGRLRRTWTRNLGMRLSSWYSFPNPADRVRPGRRSPHAYSL